MATHGTASLTFPDHQFDERRSSRAEQVERLKPGQRVIVRSRKYFDDVLGRNRLLLREPSSLLLVCKRAFDIMGAGAGLLFFAPLFALIAIAIKATSPGPVLFCQDRYGYRSCIFRIFKFRTMYIDLDDASGVRQTTHDDPRVTPIGRLLRRSSLDELPQLINVLIGDMSLVGPRPHVPRMRAAGIRYENLVPYYFQRHTMRPGLTGLAQVNGLRGSTADARQAITRIDCDLEYIEAWSLSLDLRIVLRTIKRELRSGSGE